jgi:putative sterol carrier protein
MTKEDAQAIIDERVVQKLAAQPERAKQIGKKVALKLTGECEGRWVVDCTVDPVVVKEGDVDAQSTINVDAATLSQIVAGELSAPAAFLSGKIQVDGDLGAAVSLGQLLM